MRTWIWPVAALLAGCPAPDSGKSDTETPTETDTDLSVDADEDGATAAVDCDDDDPAAYPGATEACDGVDNDCDGDTDEAGATGEGTWYADADGDDYGDADSPSSACTQPAGTVDDASDCDDGDAAVNPAASESCNEVDDDCDGSVDEDASAGTWYADEDGDGYGDDATAASYCADPGAGYASSGGDCDDDDAGVSPDGAERCDDADTDEDCDGYVDDEDPSVSETLVWYMDMDGDGYGGSTSTEACDQPAMYVRESGDCDDGTDAINPDAAETCNTLDDDCDGEADDGLEVLTWYYDADGDGWGDSSLTVSGCAAVDGYADVGQDCDDADAAVNPGATEVCDDADTDEDCDALADDDDDPVSGTSTWYLDGDGDGYGDDDGAVEACEMPTGYVDNASDPWEDATAADFLDSDDLAEVSDLVVGAAAIYAVGYDSDGDAVLVAIDPSSGTVSAIDAAGALAAPTGLALSPDGATLYVADVAAESGDDAVSGAVWAVPVGGGSADDVGVAGAVDLPVDVAVSADGSMLYLTGLDLDGQGALFGVDLGTGALSTLAAGDPLRDPLALAVSPHGAAVFVIDSMAADGGGALLTYSTSGWEAVDELASGFDLVFPGGLALDASGDVAFFTTWGDGDVRAVGTEDGNLDTVYDAAGLVPGGLALSEELIYVANLADDPTLSLVSY